MSCAIFIVFYGLSVVKNIMPRTVLNIPKLHFSPGAGFQAQLTVSLDHYIAAEIDKDNVFSIDCRCIDGGEFLSCKSRAIPCQKANQCADSNCFLPHDMSPKNKNERNWACYRLFVAQG